jgi:hypothetical protein
VHPAVPFVLKALNGTGGLKAGIPSDTIAEAARYLIDHGIN